MDYVLGHDPADQLEVGIDELAILLLLPHAAGDQVQLQRQFSWPTTCCA